MGINLFERRKITRLKSEIKPKVARTTPIDTKTICQYRGIPSGRNPVSILVAIIMFVLAEKIARFRE